MKRISRLTCTLTAMSMIALTLAACSPSESFAKAEKASLPTSLSSEVDKPVPDSVRLLGADSEGVSYYVGRWDVEGTEKYCLLSVKDEEFAQSCGNLPIVGVFRGVRATLSDQPAVATPGEGVESVGEYLSVQRL